MDDRSIMRALACLPNRPLSEAAEAAGRLGFTAIGFLGAPGSRHSLGELAGFWWDDLTEAERADLLAQRRRFERGAIHAPFQDLPLISTNRYVEQEAVRQVQMAIRAAGALSLEVVTVHCVPAGRIPLDEYWGRLVPLLRAFGEAAERAGTRIGIENTHFPTTPEEHVELLARVGHPRVGATVDLGHIAFWFKREGIVGLPADEARQRYNERLLLLLDRLGDRVFHIHAHDVRAADLRDHRTIGTGILDLDAVVRRLAERGYDGLFELDLEEEQPEVAASTSRDRLAGTLARQTHRSPGDGPAPRERPPLTAAVHDR